VDNKVLMMESRTLFIDASTPEPDENSQVLRRGQLTFLLASASELDVLALVLRVPSR
jgi:hypothetical protein